MEREVKTMKKWINKQTITAFTLGAFLFSGIGVGAASYYQFTLSENNLYVNGAKINKSMYTYQNSNYIPLRAVAETLGMDVSVMGKRIDLTSRQADIETVAKNVQSCVLIRIYSSTNPATAKLVGTASGVVLDGGFIVTNKHVLDAGEMYGVQYNDTPAGLDHKVTETCSINTNLDIGFIKSPVVVKGVKMGDSMKLLIGKDIITISSPGGLKNQILEGTISGLSDDIDGQTIQINADLDRGSSGGGVFNMNSELTGIIVSMPLDNKSFHYVIPINDIKPLLQNLDSKSGTN